MTSYPHIPSLLSSRRRAVYPDGPARPARRIALDVRRRPERRHNPW